MANLKPIEARDCSPLDIEESEQVVQAFKTLSEYFASSSPEDKDDDEPILSLRTTFNTEEKKIRDKVVDREIYWSGQYTGKEMQGYKKCASLHTPAFRREFLAEDNRGCI
jgi:hypothetical protein